PPTRTHTIQTSMDATYCTAPHLSFHEHDRIARWAQDVAAAHPSPNVLAAHSAVGFRAPACYVPCACPFLCLRHGFAPSARVVLIRAPASAALIPPSVSRQGKPDRVHTGTPHPVFSCAHLLRIRTHAESARASSVAHLARRLPVSIRMPAHSGAGVSQHRAATCGSQWCSRRYQIAVARRDQRVPAVRRHSLGYRRVHVRPDVFEPSRRHGFRLCTGTLGQVSVVRL
ncbi:unnamed protein product, partial [Mycena citricolor]